MTIFKRFLGNMRWYKALIYGYDEYLKNKKRINDINSLVFRGGKTEIHDSVNITHPDRLRVGKHCTIQSNVRLATMGGLHIGDYVGIGFNSTIVTFNHNYRNSKFIPYDDKVFLLPVVLRDYVWIGWNVCIMPGVEIGEGAIVSMGSVVTNSVPSRAIILGNPAKIIGYRSDDHFERCKAEGRVNSIRILQEFGQYNEALPLMAKRKYHKELVELGILEENT